MRRLAIGICALAALLAAGLCAAVLAVGLYLSSPASAVIGPVPPSLPGAEPVQIPSASGSSLHAWWVPGNGPGGGAVILAHGVGSNRLQMLPRARMLRRHGFAVLLLDLQAHGESPGRRITFGKLEALDAAAAAAFARTHAPGARVGYLGMSLGGAAALLGPGPLPVDALVLESVYPDIDAALVHRLHAGLGPAAGALLAPVLAPAFEHLLPPILGVAPGDLRPIDRIASVQAPLYVLSGTRDDRTPPDETQALFDRAPAPKAIWLVPGAAHVDLERFDPAAYWDRLLPFLQGILQR